MVALGEMMNFQDVLAEDEEVIKRLDAAKSLGKPIDGHAPSVSGEDLRKYVSWGISTDHECSNFAEAVEKKKAGMKIMVREGSLAKDMDTLFNIDDRLNYLIEEEMAGNIIVDNIDESLTVPPFITIMPQPLPVAPPIPAPLEPPIAVMSPSKMF